MVPSSWFLVDEGGKAEGGNLKPEDQRAEGGKAEGGKAEGGNLKPEVRGLKAERLKAET